LPMYRSVTWLLGKSRHFELFMEGSTHCIIEDGQFSIHSLEKEELAKDEFFAELRLKSIEHLGQVRNAYIETNGAISVFFYEDADVKYGLPIRPQLFDMKSNNIAKSVIYACTLCANILDLEPIKGPSSVCNRYEWVEAIK